MSNRSGNREAHIHTYRHTDGTPKTISLLRIWGGYQKLEMDPFLAITTLPRVHYINEKAQRKSTCSHMFCGPPSYKIHICVLAPRMHTVMVGKMWKCTFVWDYH
jgi:hypothetical protein